MFQDGDVILVNGKEFLINSELSDIYFKEYPNDPINPDAYYWGEYLNCEQEEYSFKIGNRLSGWKKDWLEKYGKFLRNESKEVDIEDWV